MTAKTPHAQPNEPNGRDVQPERQPQGEGNYEAARRLREEQESFAKDGQRVERAARDAAPDSAAEARELKDAERAGRAPAKH